MTHELRPLRRLVWMLAAWTLLLLATPGLVAETGSLVLAVLALVPFALAASRPGKRAFLVEWLAAGIGLSAQCYWSTYVTWITLLAVALVPALYVAVGSWLLRRSASVLPLALLLPATWIGLETLRGLVEPPLGFGWMRLGHHATGHAWLLGAARVVGTQGIGFALAALAGALADLARARRVAIASLALGVAPLGLCVLAAAATHPPATERGPRVLLVQPAVPEARKVEMRSAAELFGESIELTRRGIADAERAGGPPDLVVWGETMLFYSLAAPDLEAAFDRGARPLPWGEWQIARDDVRILHRIEREIVLPAFFGHLGRGRMLPAGTALLAGAEEYFESDGAIRRANAAILWDAEGRRAGRAVKVHPVPGGETLSGLERLEFVRTRAKEYAGYVPDFASADRTDVLDVATRGGRTYRAGVTICFDNAFDGPYTEPLRRDGLDFHVVLSNEAWYPGTFEYDQMMAFTCCLAATSARSIVRSTNSGITALVGPDGREIERLRVGGHDRDVAGTLAVDVPVPTRESAAERTFFVRFENAWIALALVLPLALDRLAARRRTVTATAA